jgi:signal transduction histidine kinase
MFSRFRPFAFLYALIGIGFLLSLLSGQVTSFLVHRNQTSSVLKSVLNATLFQENSPNFESPLRLLFSSLQANMSDDESNRLAIGFCQGNQIVASAPRWVHSAFPFNCERSYPNSLWKFELREPLPSIDQPTLAIVHRELSPWDPYAISTTLLLWLICGAFALWANRLGFERRRLVSMLERLEESLFSEESPVGNLPASRIAGWSARAGRILEQRVLELRSMVERAQKEYADSKSEAEVGKIAQHAAHDIRAPLAVIDFVSRNLSQLPEGERVLLRNAIQRFREIADDLLYWGRKSENKSQTSLLPSKTSSIGVHSLQGIVQDIVSEKMVEFKTAPGLRVSMKTDPSQYGKFVRINAGSFKRILSNVMNNAAEAMKFQGAVKVSIEEFNSESGSRLAVRISDIGPGIPAHLLPQLGNVKISYEKKGGLGLGLIHAKKSLVSWGGDLKISSNDGHGTHVDLEIPEVAPPGWFCLEITVPTSLSVVILDDDPLIHSIWDQRLSNLTALHFSNGADFSRWVGSHYQRAVDTLFLLDLELAREAETGMDLIERYGLGSSAVVVTSRYEDPALIERCIRQGCRLLPKPLAPIVPIRTDFVPGLVTDTCQDVNCEAVLVDDEADIREIWSLYANETGKKLRTFARAEDFLQISKRFRKEIPIYLDATIRNGMTGVEAAKELRAMGFSNIGLATGFPKERFQEVPWLDFVNDKRPPWGLT